MTKVIFKKNREGKITGFHAQDHAGFAESGEDIVCAAVSALVIHTVNSIDRFTDDITHESASEESAVIDFSINGVPSDRAELLLMSLASTLSDMQQDERYRNFISVKIVEV